MFNSDNSTETTSRSDFLAFNPYGGEMFVASLTRRFVSAKRLFRDLQNSKANSLSITPKVPFAFEF